MIGVRSASAERSTCTIVCSVSDGETDGSLSASLLCRDKRWRRGGAGVHGRSQQRYNCGQTQTQTQTRTHARTHTDTRKHRQTASGTACEMCHTQAGRATTHPFQVHVAKRFDPKVVQRSGDVCEIVTAERSVNLRCRVIQLLCDPNIHSVRCIRHCCQGSCHQRRELKVTKPWVAISNRCVCVCVCVCRPPSFSPSFSPCLPAPPLSHSLTYSHSLSHKRALHPPTADLAVLHRPALRGQSQRRSIICCTALWMQPRGSHSS